MAADTSERIQGELTENIEYRKSDDGDGSSDTLTSIENLTGSAFDDNFTGDANANTLTGNLWLPLPLLSCWPDRFFFRITFPLY